jgi:putative ABC transport system permease protein
MVRHFFKFAVRVYKRNRSSFLINLIGLSTGLACAMLIFLWINDERSVDKFHKNGDLLYQVLMNDTSNTGIQTVSGTPGPLAEYLNGRFAGIRYTTIMFFSRGADLMVGGNKNFKRDGYFVSPDFFKMFSFPVIAGDPDTALNDPGSMYLSESAAKGIFSSADRALGQTIVFNEQQTYVIRGVFKDPPSGSTYKFDFILPLSSIKNNEHFVYLRDWGAFIPETFVMLKEGVDPTAVSGQIRGIVHEQKPDDRISLFLASFPKRYLYGRYENGKLAGGRIEYVRLFTVVCILALLMACINFMNLSTAQGLNRAKEIGVKKAIGARRSSLVVQFLGESVFIAFVSLLIAILIVLLLLPVFDTITDKSIRFGFTFAIWIFFLGLTLVTGLVAGSYPAGLLSALRPSAILKKNASSSSVKGGLIRKGLVVFQFAVSVMLTISTLIVYRQIKYVQTQDLGYNRDHLVYFDIGKVIGKNINYFLSEAAKLPGVASISTTGHRLVGDYAQTDGLTWGGKNSKDNVMFELIFANYNLLETWQMTMAKGRSFMREYPSDTNSIVISEKAARVMGLKDPLGKKVQLWGQYQLEVVGVVKDFQVRSFYEETLPVIFWFAPQHTSYVVCRLQPGKEREALQGLETLYKSIDPVFAFTYQFADERYAKQYSADNQLASLGKYFTGFTILVSCLGLLGLAAYTVEKRRKEMGIRKALGASPGSIIILLNKDFTKLVLLGVVIAIPLAYLIVWNWLQKFSYRVSPGLWIFLIAAFIAILLAWITVSSQAIKSARVNVRESLRME